MDIALTAEGTYPHRFGGVSVWCDQLVRGLSEYDFELVALIATGGEPVRWELPPNVTGLTAIPLWGPPPPPAGPRRWPSSSTCCSGRRTRARSASPTCCAAWSATPRWATCRLSWPAR